MLHSLLVLLNTRLFGGGLPAIRLAAFSAGLLAIPLVYRVGQRIYDPFVGLLAAGLLAVSSYHIQYSVNGRGHALIVFFVLLALLLAERIRRDPAPGNWPVVHAGMRAGFCHHPGDVIRLPGHLIVAGRQLPA